MLKIRDLVVIVSLAPFWAAAGALGAEAYVVRFVAGGTTADEPCLVLYWRDRLVFHNATTQDARVKFLGVSNGPPPATAADLIVSAGRTAVVSGTSGTAQNWYPLGGGAPWVVHLDIPDGVLTESRGESAGGLACGGVDRRVFGGFALPVVRQLVMPGVSQYHLGTDIGSDGLGFAANQRINVGVYNAGALPASASVETHRACDDGLIERRTLVLPANSIVQAVGLSGNTSGCTTIAGLLYVSYAVITVDQPSFSYAVGLSNDAPPKIPVITAVTR